jgi:hypothetical protein
VAAAAAALLQLRLLEAFFFLPAAQLWSGCHEQLLQLCCRQLLGVGGSIVSRGEAQPMTHLVRVRLTGVVHSDPPALSDRKRTSCQDTCLPAALASYECTHCYPIQSTKACLKSLTRNHIMFRHQLPGQLLKNQQPQQSSTIFESVDQLPKKLHTVWVPCSADAAACVAASSLKHMLNSQDALLGPWLPGRDMLEDELRTFVGE